MATLASDDLLWATNACTLPQRKGEHDEDASFLFVDVRTGKGALPAMRLIASQRHSRQAPVA